VPDGQYIIQKSGSDCHLPTCSNCKIEKADRGWFHRRHKYCTSEGTECAAGVDAYNLVMSYAIVCGILWIAAGGLAFFASMKTEKPWIMISAALFFLGYVIFVGLFGAVMLQINEVNKDMDNYCKEVKKKIRRSGDEFMGYSICSFILIFGAILCTGIPLATL